MTPFFRFEHSHDNIRHGLVQVVCGDFGVDERVFRQRRRTDGRKTNRDQEISKDYGRHGHRSHTEQHQINGEPHQMF